jgi:hypothetical protein
VKENALTEQTESAAKPTPTPSFAPLDPSAQAELDARRARERRAEEETLGAWRAGREADTAPTPILRSDLQSLARHSALSVWALLRPDLRLDEILDERRWAALTDLVRAGDRVEVQARDLHACLVALSVRAVAPRGVTLGICWSVATGVGSPASKRRIG